MNNVFILLVFLFNLSSIAQNNRILVDGNFSDWGNFTHAYSDLLNDQNSGDVDFGKLWITNDNTYLFFRLEVGEKLNLQNDSAVELFIDTDNDTETGLSVSGIGAELKYRLGSRSGNVKLGGNNYFINHADISLVTFPTVASSQFEIAINLNSIIDGQSLFSGNTFKFLIKDNSSGNDQIPNSGETISYTLIDFISSPLPEYSLKKQENEYVRILSYNILRDSLFNPVFRENYERILQAIDPEIIGFQEIYNHTSLETAELIESMLPSESSQTWYHSKVIDLIPSNAYNTDLIVVSRFPIKASFRIPGFRTAEDRANFAVIVDLRPKYNSDLLFINAHPPSSSYNDRIRQQEIDEIMAFIRDAKEVGGELNLEPETPIIIVGDMNFVGSATQQHTLITGDIVENFEYGDDFTPDWDGSNFSDLIPYTTNLPMAFTWYDEKSDYSAGRLDYIVYSSSVLESKNSFVLFTPAMNSDSLSKYNLEAQDVVLASDHLPLVVDFQFSNLTDIGTEFGDNLINEFRLDQNYPNPFNPNTTIEYRFSSKVKYEKIKVNLEIYDIVGRKLATLVNQNQKPDKYLINFNGSNLSSGIYYYRLQLGDRIETKKMVILK